MANKLFTIEKRIRLRETDSTNSYALNLLRNQAEEGTLIQAEFQRSGRGQKGNAWTAPPGLNLTFSLICYPTFLPLNRMFQLSKAVCLALFASVQRFLPARRLAIKWPNDLLLENRKVAGILIENQLEGSQLKSSVIGVGLNVNQQYFPPELLDKACSMRHFAQVDWDRDGILEAFLASFEAYYEQLMTHDHSQLDRDYYDHLYGYQETILLQNEHGPFKGQVIGVDTRGRLAVQTEQKLDYYDFKEVQFILP